MLYWAFVFFIVSILAAIFGFGGIAIAAAGVAKIIFFVSMALFIITIVANLLSGKRRNPKDFL